MSSSGSLSRGAETRGELKISSIFAFVSYAERAVGLIGQILIVRFLEVDHYGLFVSASYAVLFVSLVCSSGGVVVVITGLSGRPWRGIATLSRTVLPLAARRGSLAIAGTLILTIIGIAVPATGWFPVVFFLGVGIAADGALALVRYGLFAHGKVGGFAVTSIFVASVRIAGLILGALITGTATGAAIGSALASVTTLLGAILLVAPRWGSPPTESELLRDSFAIFASAIFAFLYFRQDLWIVQALASNREAGIYGLFLRLHEIALALPAAYSSVVLRMASSHSGRGADRAQIARWLAASLSIGLLASLALVLGSLLDFSRWFGTGYAAASPLLRLSAVLYLPLAVNSLILSLLYATGRARQVTIGLAAATLVGFGLGVVLTKHHGVTGAAIAKVGAEVTLLIVLTLFWGYHREDRGLIAGAAVLTGLLALAAAVVPLIGWIPR